MNSSNSKEPEVGAERFSPEGQQSALTARECQLDCLFCVVPFWIGSDVELAEFNRGTRLICAIALVVAIPWPGVFVWLPAL